MEESNGFWAVKPSGFDGGAVGHGGPTSMVLQQFLIRFPTPYMKIQVDFFFSPRKINQKRNFFFFTCQLLIIILCNNNNNIMRVVSVKQN